SRTSRPRARPRNGHRSPLIKTFWKVTIGIPRFLMAFPTMEVAGIKMAAKGNYAILGGWSDLLTPHFLKYSILLLLLIWPGTAYWCKRHRGVAAVLLTLIVGQILYFGLTG